MSWSTEDLARVLAALTNPLANPTERRAAQLQAVVAFLEIIAGLAEEMATENDTNAQLGTTLISCAEHCETASDLASEAIGLLKKGQPS